jgi:T5SS/PEP-CTERM-associated repeat protein
VRRSFHWVAVVLCLQGGWCALSLADSYTTNIISGVSTSAATDFIVGDTGSFNYLEINDGGLVTSGDGILGNSIAASNNTVLVTDTNSAWVTSPYGMYIGETSGGNSLIISNGGLLSSTLYSVIGDTHYANNNLVIVTGTNSVWSNNGSLVIGVAGSGNQLQILNGGQVLSNNSVWLSTYPASSNNTLVVTGPNSRLVDNGTFVMGAAHDPGSQFTLSGGATFICNGASIDGGADVVTVTGSNTVWNNRGAFLLGVSQGSGNQLTIGAGAVVSNFYAGIGAAPALSNNAVLVTGSNTLWQIDSYFYVSSPGNMITVTNGARVNSKGMVIDSAPQNTSNPNVVTVAGGSAWSNAGSLFVGYSYGGNELDIEGGSQVVGSTNITLGAGYGSNTITIAGQNSRLTDSGSFDIGGIRNSGLNRVTVSNGGALITPGTTTVGIDGAAGNVISISGIGSVWTNGPVYDTSGGVYVDSSSNVISITDGAYMNGGVQISGGNDNLVLMSGPGTRVDGGFYIGSYEYMNNALVISNGAVLNGGFGLDYNSTATLTGTNTTCNDSGTLYVIADNQMSILDGAQLLGEPFVYVNGSGCSINVAGNGARWGEIGQIYFGFDSDSNNLTVGVGGYVDAAQMDIGADSSGYSSGSNDLITVAGALTVTNGGAGQIQLQNGQIALQQGVVMADLLSISAGAAVTGCGTIIGNINNSGTLSVTCPGGTLTLNGIVTNNASIVATNGGDIEFLGSVVNNGTIDLVNGFGHFLGGFVNNGVYRNAGTVLMTPSLNFNNVGMVISFGSVSGKTYAVDYTDQMMPTNWAVLFGGIMGTGGTMQFTDTSAIGLTQRFYRVHLSLP